VSRPIFRNRLIAALALLTLWLVAPAAARASDAPGCVNAGPVPIEQGQTVGFPPAVLCYDDDADPLTLDVVSQPEHGTLIGPDSTGGYGYTAPSDYLGPDSFSVRAFDGTSYSNTVTISLDVVPPSDGSPQCYASLGPEPPGNRVEVEGGDVIQGSISCSDDSPQLSYSVQQQPAHGSVTNLQRNPPLGGYDAAGFRYEVDAGYRGDDQFMLRVSDGANAVEVVVLVTVVDPREEAPVCYASMTGTPIDSTGRYLVETGEATQGTVSCTDDEGDPLTFAVGDGPEHGALSPLQTLPPAGAYKSATLSYTPEPAYRGPDQFKLRVSDGTHEVDAVVKVEVVEAVNNLPVCYRGLDEPYDGAGGYFVEDGETAVGSIGCSDDENAPITFTVVDAPDHGTLSALQPQPPSTFQSVSFTYTPDAGYRGDDQFTIRVNDGTHELSVTLPVKVIEPANDPPVCSGAMGMVNLALGPIDVEAGEAESGELFCRDDEDDELTFSVAAPPGHSTLDVDPYGRAIAELKLTPDTGYRGADQFTVRVSDGANHVDIVVHVNVVDPVNDAPLCNAFITFGEQPFRVEAGERYQGSVSCFDEEGGLSFSVKHGPAHGTISGLSAFQQSAGFSYTPDLDYRGADGITLLVTDGPHSVEVPIAVTVVEPVNDPPSCTNIGAITREQGETLLLEEGHACYDPEGEPLTLTIIDEPEHGTITGPDEDGLYTYTAPAAPFTGPDSFDVRISDGVNHIDRTVTIQVVESKDDPPQCADHSHTVRQPAFVVIQPDCYDDEDDELSYEVIDQPEHGTLTGDPANGWIYTPAHGYIGADSFRYEAGDGANTVAVTVDIDVEGAARLTLTPREDTPEVGATHRVTATVRTPDGTPQAGLQVDWSIHGAGAEIAGDAVTNAFGQVEIAWTRTATGADELEAEVEGDSATARALWRAESPVAPPDAGSPTKPNGSPLPNVHIGEIVDPSDPGERYFTVSRSETTAAGVGSCPNVPDSRALRLPISVVIDPGAGEVIEASLFQTAPGASPGDSPLTPPGIEYPEVNGDTYTFVLDCIRSGDLYVSYLLSENGQEEWFTIPVGGIVLIDPQGVVYDQDVYEHRKALGDSDAAARAAAAIEGATVRLERKVGDDWVPVLSGDPGISPHINPQVTGADGKYQWDVSAGVYRVVVSKDGYVTKGSDAVNIPPPVLDLHVALEPVADTLEPETTITAGPPFEFSSTEAGTFECRIDAGAFAPCSSPYTVPALAPGSHTFEVRAIDAAGNPDPSPAQRVFIVTGGSPPASGGGGSTGGGGGSTGGGSTSTDPCQGKNGRALAKCKLAQHVAKKCGGLSGKKKTLCGKRERAIAKCNGMKSKSKSQKAKKKTCLRKAKKIGKKK
jgi:hypothetical protein